MLTNFEEYTQDLSELHQSIAFDLALCLESWKGFPVTSKQIIEYFEGQQRRGFYSGVKMSEALVRKMINWICRNLLSNLIGTKKGYFITDNPEELKKAAGTLQSRANENQRRADVIIKYLSTKYGLKYNG